ncbi:hypothetical protein [uncultured Microbulbifer sp.]|nr:hypothetical protein [uncultured Microbulbifer sp.]
MTLLTQPYCSNHLRVRGSVIVAKLDFLLDQLVTGIPLALTAGA